MLHFRFEQHEAQEMKQLMQIILAGIRGIFDNTVESGGLADEKEMVAPHSSKRRKH